MMMEFVLFVSSKLIYNELRNQIDAFFSGEYEQDVNQIKSSIKQYNTLTEELLRRLNALRKGLSSYPAAQIDAEKPSSAAELLEGYFAKTKLRCL